MDALVIVGEILLSCVVAIWCLWLANQAGVPRGWKLLTLAVVPCIATPLVLGSVLSERTLGDVAKGALLVLSVLVAIGTLMHAARGQRLESE